MDDALTAELQVLMGEVIGVSGAVVATADGLLLASAVDVDEDEMELEAVAALAAATSGVGIQFSRILSLGEATGTVIQAGNGCAAVHSLGEAAILVMYSTDGASVARLHLAARQAIPRLIKVLKIHPLGRPMVEWTPASDWGHGV